MSVRREHRTARVGVYIATVAVALGCGTGPEAETADDRVTWLAGAAVPLRSFDITDTDFADLDALRTALAGVDVVLLGEATHGDGAAFLAKGRLIRFLYEEMGFRVLLMEAELFACEELWADVIADPAATQSILEGCVTFLFGQSEQMRPLFEFIGSVANDAEPLRVGGIDPMPAGNYSDDRLAPAIETFLTETGSAVLADPRWPSILDILGRLARRAYRSEPVPAASTQTDLLEVIDDALTEIGPATPGETRRIALYRQILRSVRAYAVWEWHRRGNPDGFDQAVFNLRDLQMGENVLAHATSLFPGAKIIVSAANIHTAHGVAAGVLEADTPSPFYDPVTRTMGDVVHDALGARSYAIAFTAYEGLSGTVFATPRAIGRSHIGDLEYLLVEAGFSNAWLDLRDVSGGGEWLVDNVVSRPFGYTRMQAAWPTVFDGMVLTQVMFPSTALVP